MNFDPDRKSATLNATLNTENEQLSSENAALVESLTAVYYYANSTRKELEKEHGLRNAAEKDLAKAELDIKRLVDSHRGLCQSLRDERENRKEDTKAISVLKTKERAKNIAIAVLALLLAGAVAGLFLQPRQDKEYRALVEELREASHATAEVVEIVPDSIRYKYEAISNKKW